MTAHTKLHCMYCSLDEHGIYRDHKRANDIKVIINHSMLNKHTNFNTYVNEGLEGYLKYDNPGDGIKQSPSVISNGVASMPKQSFTPTLHQFNTNNRQ